LHAVASSDLVACIQESVVERFGKNLNLMSCPEPLGLPPFVLRMVWHRQRDNDSAHVWLRKLISRRIAGNLAGLDR
jgi:DNA-binding transcriptional LysR family regulator